MSGSRSGSVAAGRSARTESTRKPRVLVVEDSFLTAHALSSMVRDLGYEVVGPVSTLSGALRILEEGRVDGALIDVNLRGQLVTPVADRLVELGSPFVFFTAHARLEPLPAVYRDRPTLRKPCTPEDLARVLGAIV